MTLSNRVFFVLVKKPTGQGMSRNLKLKKLAFEKKKAMGFLRYRIYVVVQFLLWINGKMLANIQKKIY